MRQFADICKRKKSLSVKLDFSSENVAVGFLKYMFQSLGSQRQFVDIGQSGDICKRKKHLSLKFDFPL